MSIGVACGYRVHWVSMISTFSQSLYHGCQKMALLSCCQPRKKDKCCTAAIRVVHKVEEVEDREADDNRGRAEPFLSGQTRMNLPQQFRDHKVCHDWVDKVGEAEEMRGAERPCRSEQQVANSISNGHDHRETKGKG